MRPKKIGIYQIINIINNKKYIGSSIDMYKRWTEHKRHLRRNKHHSIALQRAWNKYKEESFIFEVIEELSSIEFLKAKEQNYLNQFKPEYNTSKSSICPMLGRKHSQETIQKFKQRPKKLGPDNHAYGKKWTEERKQEQIKKMTGQKRTEETKAKQRAAALKRRAGNVLLPFILKQRKPIQDSNGNIFVSLSEAGKFWSISVQTVCDILKGRHNHTRKGISFTYV